MLILSPPLEHGRIGVTPKRLWPRPAIRAPSPDVFSDIAKTKKPQQRSLASLRLLGDGVRPFPEGQMLGGNVGGQPGMVPDCPQTVTFLIACGSQ